VIDQSKVDKTDDEGNDPVHNRLTHLLFPPQLGHTLKNVSLHRPSARALDASEPIKKPETDCASDVENHLADLDLNFTVRCSRCHRVSFSMMGKVDEVCEVRVFLDRSIIVCYSIFVAERGNPRKIMAKNSKVFDIIVLAGMVVNIILAVFLILYYFNFL
jgi:hypothetical protein